MNKKKYQRFSYSTPAERDSAHAAVSKVISGDHKITILDRCPEFLLFVATTGSCDKDAQISQIANNCRCMDFVEEIYVASFA